MAKLLSEKKAEKPIPLAVNSDAERTLDERKADLERRLRDLEAQRRQLDERANAMAVERNELSRKQEQQELDRRNFANDREHVRNVAAEISRLARTL